MDLWEAVPFAFSAFGLGPKTSAVILVTETQLKIDWDAIREEMS